jgi:hypothetical protein
VALGGGKSYGEVAFGGAVYGVAIGGSDFDTNGGECLVQEWSCGVGEAECATVTFCLYKRIIVRRYNEWAPPCQSVAKD